MRLFDELVVIRLFPARIRTGKLTRVLCWMGRSCIVGAVIRLVAFNLRQWLRKWRLLSAIWSSIDRKWATISEVGLTIVETVLVLVVGRRKVNHWYRILDVLSVLVGQVLIIHLHIILFGVILIYLVGHINVLLWLLLIGMLPPWVNIYSI